VGEKSRVRCVSFFFGANLLLIRFFPSAPKPIFPVFFANYASTLARVINAEEGDLVND